MPASSFDRMTPSDAPPEAEGYRLLSRLAVAAAGLAVASTLAFFWELFWVLPILTVVCGAAALWRISRDPQRLGGGSLALFAVVLGGFILAFVTAQAWQRQALLAQNARQHAETWLRLLRQSAEDPQALFRADQLMLPYEQREAEGVPLEEHYAEPDAEQIGSMTPMVLEQLPARALDRKFNTDPLKTLLQALRGGARATYRGVARTRRLRNRGLDQVGVVFFIEAPQLGSKEIQVVMRREAGSLDQDQEGAHWSVDGVENIGSPLPPPY